MLNSISGLSQIPFSDWPLTPGVFGSLIHPFAEMCVDHPLCVMCRGRRSEQNGADARARPAGFEKTGSSKGRVSCERAEQDVPGLRRSRAFPGEMGWRVAPRRAHLTCSGQPGEPVGSLLTPQAPSQGKGCPCLFSAPLPLSPLGLTLLSSSSSGHHLRA